MDVAEFNDRLKDWRSMTAAERSREKARNKLRADFDDFYLGWDDHDNGGKRNPPQGWSPERQERYLKGFDAARRTMPERAIEGLADLDDGFVATNTTS